MAYTRTYTIDAGPTGDTVKAAIATKLDGDLTNAYTYLNAHDVATTNVHGLGTAYVVGTTTAQTLTNKTISSPTITGTVTASGATIASPTITGGTATNMTLVTPTSLGVTWTDYSSTSTVDGFSGTPSIYIRYCVVGKLVFVHFYLSGTSNSTALSFTLPLAIELFTAGGVDKAVAPCYVQDDSTVSDYPGSIRMRPSSGGGFTVECHKTMDYTDNWTASGTKAAAGQFFYPTA